MVKAALEAYQKGQEGSGEEGGLVALLEELQGALEEEDDGEDHGSGE